MTYEEWFDLAKTMKRIYQREEKFMPDEETVKLMYSMVEDLEYNKAKVAVTNYIKCNKFSPTIADIREEYDRIATSEKKEYAEINRFYEQARAYYPGSGEIGYGKKEFFEKAKTPEQAERLYNAIVRYVNNCTDTTMDFKACITTISAPQTNKNKRGDKW